MLLTQVAAYDFNETLIQGTAPPDESITMIDPLRQVNRERESPHRCLAFVHSDHRGAQGHDLPGIDRLSENFDSK